MPDPIRAIWIATTVSLISGWISQHWYPPPSDMPLAIAAGGFMLTLAGLALMALKEA